MVLGGNCTIRREDLDRGFEPDDWVLPRHNCDPDDPANSHSTTRLPHRSATRSGDQRSRLPADCSIASTSMQRCESRELWRVRWDQVWNWSLQANGKYVPTPTSHYFPVVSVAAIAGCVADMSTVDDAARLRRFREWVRSPYRPFLNVPES